MEEEDNIDEDLDAAVVIIESAPKQVSKHKIRDFYHLYLIRIKVHAVEICLQYILDTALQQ